MKCDFVEKAQGGYGDEDGTGSQLPFVGQIDLVKANFLRAQYGLLRHELSIFRLRERRSPIVFGVLVNCTYYGMIFVLSLYLQQVLGYSTLGAGLVAYATQLCNGGEQSKW